MTQFQPMKLGSASDSGKSANLIGPFQSADLWDLVGGRKKELTIDEQLEAALSVERSKIKQDSDELNVLRGQLQGSLEALKSAVADLENDKSAWWESVQKEMTKIALHIAEKVVDAEIKANPEIILKGIKVLVQKISEEEKKIIIVNPEDLDFLKKNDPSSIENLEKSAGVTFMPNEAMARGSCRFETMSHVHEWSTPKRLEFLWSELFPQVAENADSGIVSEKSNEKEKDS